MWTNAPREHTAATLTLRVQTLSGRTGVRATRGTPETDLPVQVNKP